MKEILEKAFPRKSKQREEILKFLMSTKSHPTANEVYEQVKKVIPDISLGTVYRNLRELSEKGIILELKAKDGINNYDYDTSTHGHFVCEKCGKIYDVFDLQITNQPSLSDFAIKSVNAVFYGICNQCK